SKPRRRRLNQRMEGPVSHFITHRQIAGLGKGKIRFGEFHWTPLRSASCGFLDANAYTREHPQAPAFRNASGDGHSDSDWYHHRLPRSFSCGPPVTDTDFHGRLRQRAKARTT